MRESDDSDYDDDDDYDDSGEEAEEEEGWSDEEKPKPKNDDDDDIDSENEVTSTVTTESTVQTNVLPNSIQPPPNETHTTSENRVEEPITNSHKEKEEPNQTPDLDYNKHQEETPKQPTSDDKKEQKAETKGMEEEGDEGVEEHNYKQTDLYQELQEIRTKLANKTDSAPSVNIKKGNSDPFVLKAEKEELYGNQQQQQQKQTVTLAKSLDKATKRKSKKGAEVSEPKVKGKHERKHSKGKSSDIINAKEGGSTSTTTTTTTGLSISEPINVVVMNHKENNNNNDSNSSSNNNNEENNSEENENENDENVGEGVSGRVINEGRISSPALRLTKRIAADETDELLKSLEAEKSHSRKSIGDIINSWNLLPENCEDANERMRNRTINEVALTERDYVEDLNYIIDVRPFIHSI